MRINRLTIRNFKGFEDRSLDFPPPHARADEPAGSFHLLVGENGSGKSTALDAVAVALGIWHVARPAAGWRAIRKGEARLVQIKDGDRTRFEPMPDAAIEAAGVIGDQAVSWVRMNKGHSTRTSNAEAQEALAVVEALLKRSRTPEVEVTLPVLAYYGAGRAWLPQTERVPGSQQQSGKVSRFDAYYSSLDGRIRDRELNEWFLFEALEAFQRGEKRAGMKVVEAAVLACLPDARALRFDADRREIVVVLKQGKGGEVPYYSLSDGQRAMLSLVADLARKAVILNPHLGHHAARKSPGVVLIDELDLHLHPKWQRQVVADLKRTFPAMQFICTTHSPFIIQSVAAGELIRLDGDVAPEEYADASIEDIAEAVQGIRNPQRSQRAEAVDQAAQEYFALLRAKKKVPRSRLARAEATYRKAAAPFASDAGISALLKLEALAAAKEGGHA
ncbi:MAG: AAA family ATPase [Verrucomicrobiae bacterium]|nr:AAA family ATPase [Verrucomicrobiae bacterium]